MRRQRRLLAAYLSPPANPEGPSLLIGSEIRAVSRERGHQVSCSVKLYLVLVLDTGTDADTGTWHITAQTLAHICTIWSEFVYFLTFPCYCKQCNVKCSVIVRRPWNRFLKWSKGQLWMECRWRPPLRQNAATNCRRLMVRFWRCKDSEGLCFYCQVERTLSSWHCQLISVKISCCQPVNFSPRQNIWSNLCGIWCAGFRLGRWSMPWCANCAISALPCCH